MLAIKLPPKNSLSFNRLNADFVEKRRAALDEYYQRVLRVQHVTSFNQRASLVLKHFLGVDERVAAYGAVEHPVAVASRLPCHPLRQEVAPLVLGQLR